MSCQNVYYFTTFLFLCQDFFKVFFKLFSSLKWSGQWESNPPFQLGRLEYQPIYDTRIINCRFKMVGVTGIEPATSWSQTTRAPICATPREHLVSLENTLSLNDKDYSTISYLIRQHFFSTFFIFFHFFYFNSSINASTG